MDLRPGEMATHTEAAEHNPVGVHIQAVERIQVEGHIPVAERIQAGGEADNIEPWPKRRSKTKMK
jgi:hypothetical protein